MSGDSNKSRSVSFESEESEWRISVPLGNLYPSLDHIVPVFAGGGDSLDNVQLAHYRCNTLRGVEDWKRHRQKLA